MDNYLGDWDICIREGTYLTTISMAELSNTEGLSFEEVEERVWERVYESFEIDNPVVKLRWDYEVVHDDWEITD